MNLLFPEERCIEPLGESLSDYEVVCKIAERLGLLEEYTGGKTVPELIKLGYETSRAAHLDQLGGPAARRATTWSRPIPDWEKIPAGLIEFYEDPEKHPLTTPTGKLEFYSTGLAEHFPDDLERPPVPKWIPKGVYHEETLGTERSKKYPLLVMSNHPRWGVHSAARRHHLAARDRDLQGHGPGRVPVPAAVDEPGGRRSPRHQDTATWSPSTTSGARCWPAPT